MIVYKYCPPDRVDILENGMIRFSQPAAMNDPFESYPDFTDLKSYMFKSLFAEHLQMFGKASADADRPQLEKMTEQAVENIPHGLGEHFALLCLTKQRNNLLMWAHYTNSHRGFVIGFDADHDFFKPGGRIGSEGLREVGYSTRRPVLPKDGGTSLDRREGNNIMFYTKSSEWSYEQELRVIALPAAATKTFPVADGVNICLFDFPADCVKEVILGYRMPADVKQKIIDLLKSKYPSADLFQAHLNPHHFALDVKPVVP